jgi:hypothetical protein
MTGHPLDLLTPRNKPPSTVRAIETWIQQAERKVGVGARRLGWMVASGVVIAALQRAVHSDGKPRFLVKGGTYLELRLGLGARSTKDLDTLFRGYYGEYLEVLDRTLARPFDGITFQRTEPRPIDIPGRLMKPFRIDVSLKLRGRTWRRIMLEVAPDEGQVGARVDLFRSPSLAHFGFTTPPTTAGIVVDYQVAQKLHACTEPHTFDRPNDRVRDIVDLQVLRSALYNDRVDLSALKQACQDLFHVRAREAELAGKTIPRPWPPTVVIHSHWQTDYQMYAREVDLDLTLDEAVSSINQWIAEIAAKRQA